MYILGDVVKERFFAFFVYIFLFPLPSPSGVAQGHVTQYADALQRVLAAQEQAAFSSLAVVWAVGLSSRAYARPNWWLPAIVALLDLPANPP